MTYYIADGNKVLFEQFDNIDDACNFVKNIIPDNFQKINGSKTYLILKMSKTQFSGIAKQSLSCTDYNIYLYATYELVRTLKVTYKEYTEIEYIT